AVVEVRLTANQRDLPYAEVRELLDEIQRLRQGELVGTRSTCPGATVPASQVAAQGQLPNRINGTVLGIGGSRLGERKPPPARRKGGQEREGSAGGTRHGTELSKTCAAEGVPVLAGKLVCAGLT